MSGYPVTIKRLKGQGIVRVAAKHNLREIAAEIGAAGHIDPARIQSNLVLRGAAKADEVAAAAKALMADAGITRQRVGSVMALELVFTLPPTANVDVGAYFEDATQWAERFYQVPLLSSVIHLDEAAPHCHVLLLPIADGRMIGSDLHGGRAKLMAMQAAFQEQVRARYGIARQAPAKRHSAAVRAEALELARKCLDENSGLADDVIAALLKPHAKDPEPLLLALGLPMPTPTAPSKSFVAIMTQPTKTEQRNPIGKGSANPIGKAQQAASKTMLPYPCVGKGVTELASGNSKQHEGGATEPTSASTSPPTHDAAGRTVSTTANAANTGPLQADQPNDDTDEPADRFTRERDSDRCADHWNTETGEWATHKPTKTSAKAIAAAAVRVALVSIGRRHDRQSDR